MVHFIYLYQLIVRLYKWIYSEEKDEEKKLKLMKEITSILEESRTNDDFLKHFNIETPRSCRNCKNPNRLSGWFGKYQSVILSVDEDTLEIFNKPEIIKECSSFVDLNSLLFKPILFSPPPMISKILINNSSDNFYGNIYDRQQILSWIYIFGWKDPVGRKLRSHIDCLVDDPLENIYVAFRLQEYERAMFFIDALIQESDYFIKTELLILKGQLLLSSNNINEAMTIGMEILSLQDDWKSNNDWSELSYEYYICGLLILAKCEVIKREKVKRFFNLLYIYKNHPDVGFYLAHIHTTNEEIDKAENMFNEISKKYPNHPNIIFYQKIMEIGLCDKLPSLTKFDEISEIIKNINININGYTIYQMYVLISIFNDKYKLQGKNEALFLENEGENLLTLLRKVDEIIVKNDDCIEAFYVISSEIVSNSIISACNVFN
uniref:TPR_REGION domain-containing protein n=1 Tax=Parastrongyloides trichosuri TaxID=131310 RepID=A0A0N5A197_PARTI